MKFLKRSAVFICLPLFWAGPALGDIWTATCGNILFKFNRTTFKSEIYFHTSGGTFQIASGKITFDNGSALRSPMEGIPDGPLGPQAEIGINKSRGLVYVLYRNPETGQKKDGVLCKTPITQEP